MNAEFINPFIAALLNVMQTMAQTTVSARKTQERKVIDQARGTFQA